MTDVNGLKADPEWQKSFACIADPALAGREGYTFHHGNPENEADFGLSEVQEVLEVQRGKPGELWGLFRLRRGFASVMVGCRGNGRDIRTGRSAYRDEVNDFPRDRNGRIEWVYG